MQQDCPFPFLNATGQQKGCNRFSRCHWTSLDTGKLRAAQAANQFSSLREACKRSGALLWLCETLLGYWQLTTGQMLGQVGTCARNELPSQLVTSSQYLQKINRTVNCYESFQGTSGDIHLVGGLEHEYYFSIQLGMSSSQLTNSYFSEGWLNHQAVFMVCEDWKKVSISKGYNRFSQCPVRPGFHLLGPDSAQCVLLAPRRETTLSQVMTKPHVKPHICIYNHIISYMYIYIYTYFLYWCRLYLLRQGFGIRVFLFQIQVRHVEIVNLLVGRSFNVASDSWSFVVFAQLSMDWTVDSCFYHLEKCDFLGLF